MHVKYWIRYAVVHMHGYRIPTKLDWHAACGDSQSRQESHTLVAQVFATCCLFIEYQKRVQFVFRLHNSSLRSCYHEHRTYFWLQPCKNSYIIKYHALKIIIELGSILLDERLNFVSWAFLKYTIIYIESAPRHLASDCTEAIDGCAYY